MSKKTTDIEPSVTCGFYDSLNGDRKYFTSEINCLFDGLITDGIFSSIGDKLIVHAGGGNTVNVGTGKCWFNRTWTQNDAVLPVVCAEAPLLDGMNRYDAIVVTVNTTQGVRDNFIEFLQGEEASNAKKPSMECDPGIYRYPLCYIYRAGGSTSIVEANIENMVGVETPFVTGIVQQVTIDELLGQWRAELDDFIAKEKSDADSELSEFISSNQAEWDEWYSGITQTMEDALNELNAWTDNQKNTFLAWIQEMKDQLSEDAAGNLQLQLDEEEIRRILLVGFADGTKEFSEDGSVSVATDSSGRVLTKTFTNNFLTSTTVLEDAFGNVLGALVKTFSEDGLTTSSEMTIV